MYTGKVVALETVVVFVDATQFPRLPGPSTTVHTVQRGGGMPHNPNKESTPVATAKSARAIGPVGAARGWGVDQCSTTKVSVHTSYSVICTFLSVPAD